MKDYKNILVIKMSSLGDIIHALPAVGAIRKNWPNAKITWAVQSNFADLIPASPVVDEIIKIDRKRLFSWKYIKELRQELHSRNFDVVIDLQCILKSAIIQLISGCDERYGYSDAKEGSQFLCKVLKGENANGNIIERYLDLVRELGGSTDDLEVPLFPLDEEEVFAKNLLQELGVTGKYAVFALATRWENKDWPPEYYAKLAEHIAKDDFTIVLTGVPSDQPKVDLMMANIQNAKVVSLIGKTNIKQMFAVVKNANFFVGGDTGPMHFASLAKVPLIALFGATYPNRSGAYGNPCGHNIVSPTAPKDQSKLSNNDSSVMRGLLPNLVIEQYDEMKLNGEFND